MNGLVSLFLFVFIFLGAATITNEKLHKIFLHHMKECYINGNETMTPVEIQMCGMTEMIAEGYSRKSLSAMYYQYFPIKNEL